MRGAAKPRVKIQALIPERSGIGDLGHSAPEEDGGEIGDPTDMAQRLQDQSDRLPATRRPVIDADVGTAARNAVCGPGCAAIFSANGNAISRLKYRGCLFRGASKAGASVLRETPTLFFTVPTARS
jgi:hypothetical protein